MPSGFFRTLARPPGRENLGNFDSLQRRLPLRAKFRDDVPHRDGSESAQSTLFGVSDIVSPGRQIGHADKAPGRHSRQISDREHIVPAIALVHQRERHRVTDAHEGIPASRGHVAGVFVKRDLPQ